MRVPFSVWSVAVWSWIRRLGPFGLILLGIADNTPAISVPAGGVDVFLILLCASNHEWWAYYAFMASVGEILGGYLTYRSPRRAARRL